MIHFVLGTEAELIKVFPLMVELKKKKIPYNFIATGQHKLNESDVLRIFALKKPDSTLYKGPVFTSALKMFAWVIKKIFLPQDEIKKIFKNDTDGIVFVHGDTVSTAMGAILTKRAGLRLAHIEAGMWSRNYFNPFPEEIDRRLVSKLSDINFCPSDKGYNNLITYPDKIVINTKQNTQLDSFKLVRKYFHKVRIPKLPKKYFIFILHRTENLTNRHLVVKLVNKILEQSQRTKCILVLHHTSKDVFTRYGLMNKIDKNQNIIKLSRMGYPEFIKVLDNAEFLVTDGGGNQMEAAYLGLPTLLLRQLTESPEGIGRNVILSKLNFQIIDEFFNNYSIYRTKPYLPKISPTKVIIKNFLKEYEKSKVN